MGHLKIVLGYINAAAFADLDSVSLHVPPNESSSRLFLQLGYNQNWLPRQYVWRIPPQFGALDVIAQLIIENHLRYTLEHPD